jgi:hypothetical protein
VAKSTCIPTDVLSRLAKAEFDPTLDSRRKALHFVDEKTPGNVLLKTSLRRRPHLFGVVDE